MGVNIDIHQNRGSPMESVNVAAIGGRQSGFTTSHSLLWCWPRPAVLEASAVRPDRAARPKASCRSSPLSESPRRLAIHLARR
ncbi:hypothetical protein [Streptomyces sp. NPDC029554]|uniref:hypothetical protein n=1 Tax=Streptomyces sp. NPDC029554 TaxID=3155126 RepID=UPI003406D0E0